MNVTITPDSEANYILSSVAASKLRLKRDVALAGESVPYRDAKLYYTLFGMLDDPLTEMMLSLLVDDAVSVAMTKASTLDRVCATVEMEPVEIVRPTKPIIL